MKYIKYLLVLAFGVFSFYASDKLVLYVESISPIMNEIKEVKDKYETSPVNAIIDGDYITPGLSGKKVRIRDSYLKMNDFGAFNELFFKYDYIKPEVSILDNLDKIIRKSYNNGSVSLVLLNENEYLNKNNIKYDLIVDKYIETKSNIELLNGNVRTNDFNNLNKILNKKKINKKICIINVTDKDECIKNKYYLVDYTLEFKKNTLALNKNKIEEGNIIFISSYLTDQEIEIIINQIKYKNLEIIHLSELIKE